MSGSDGRRAIVCLVLGMLSFAKSYGWAAMAPARCKGMSVRDMVRVARFQQEEYPGAPNGEVETSPDGKYVVVVTQRGVIGANSAVGTLRVWSVPAIRAWLQRQSPRPAPVVKVSLRSNSQASFWGTGNAVISGIRWSADSKHLLLLGRRPNGRGFDLYSTVPEGPLKGHLQRLSGRNQNVLSFIVDRAQIIYQVAALTEKDLRRSTARQDALPYFDGTGKSLFRLLLPASLFGGSDQVQLWRIVRGARSRIRVRSRRWEIRESGMRLMAPSADGLRLLMDLPVRFVPRSWMQYGHGTYPAWARTGPVPYGDVALWSPHQYVIVDQTSGRVQAVLPAPDGDSRGFLAGVPGDPLRISGDPWAPDGAAILLWNAFLPRHGEEVRGGGLWGVTKPCLAVVDVARSRGRCAETLWSRGGAGTLLDSRWGHGRVDRLLLIWKRQRKTMAVPFCVSTGSVHWIRQCGRAFAMRRIARPGRLKVRIAQSLNSPPELVAAIGATVERVLYDPNAKLRKQCIGHVQTVKLDVGNGREVEAGLLLPLNYVPGRRYPLILQTHGYDPTRFMSTGRFPPFAARAFAASGMAVMQLPECSIGTPKEIPCSLNIYRAALNYANALGFANPHKVGIIGFSRTCEHVLPALEDAGLHFAAAELVDGVMTTYSQFVEDVDLMQGFSDAFEVQEMGGAPVGSGLKTWLSRAAGFSMDKITAPLLVQADGRIGVLSMWEPYAILHYMGRPVDLVVLQRGSHPASNPAQARASERLGIDWFRFWLEGKRPASESEYLRWSKLRASGGRKIRSLPRA